MKKIVSETPTHDIVLLEHVKNRSYPLIGISCHSNGAKGFLVPLHYRGKPMTYRAVARAGFSYGNCWDMIKGKEPTLDNWLEYFKDSDLFLFEDEKELFKWLSE